VLIAGTASDLCGIRSGALPLPGLGFLLPMVKDIAFIAAAARYDGFWNWF
jgi:hypothetical protein